LDVIQKTTNYSVAIGWPHYQMEQLSDFAIAIVLGTLNVMMQLYSMLWFRLLQSKFPISKILSRMKIMVILNNDNSAFWEILHFAILVILLGIHVFSTLEPAQNR
jgi:hypothetical protein